MDPKDPRTRKQLRNGFEKALGAGGALRCALAPGRVNLIGEHTDYNGGFVLPMAIARHTAVVFRPSAKPRLRVHAADIAAAKGEPDDEFGLAKKDIARLDSSELHWANYVRGVAAVLAERGVKLKGGDLFIHADLPQGAGLSSSASLEVATALALLALAGKKLEPQQLALACQRAEHTYAGVRCGIMDQTVVARAKAGHALLLDCRDLTVRHVAIRLKGWGFAAFDTGVRHKLAGSEYNKRRAECERAAKLFGVKTLRDAGIDDLLARGARLTPSEWRRARHAITENFRTLHFAAALEAGDILTLGRLLAEGHQSLALDYEVSCLELDWLQIALWQNDAKGRTLCAGARMTGGGFGGSVVALIRPRAFAVLREQSAAAYREAFGRAPGGAMLLEPASGAEVVGL